MNEVVFILFSALFLSIPLGVKYLLAFQTRHLLERLKKGEKEVQYLGAQLEALESEKVVLRRVLRQVERRRRQARSRLELTEERLERIRQALEPIDPVQQHEAVEVS
jgi:chromosome segregation ATPase